MDDSLVLLKLTELSFVQLYALNGETIALKVRMEEL
jgi:hypothetical protein